jgi:hypothetical protein
MKPLTVVYWSRVGLGIIAGLFCTLLARSSFLSGLSFGILFYILTYYILKRLFVVKVEKPSDLFKMGIGAYFLSLIISWVLLFSLMHPTAIFTYSPESPVVSQQIIFDATESYDLNGHIINYAWNFGDETKANTTEPLQVHTYALPENYTVTLTVTDSEGYKASESKNLDVRD